jgi:predicted transcriptional regulator
MKLITQKQLDKKIMRRSYFRKEHPELDLEFALISALIKARAKGEITQKQLAEKMGTKQSAIARFESGRSNPTLDFIKRLAEALELELKVSVRKAASV